MQLRRVLTSVLIAGGAGYAGYRAARWYEARRPVEHDPCDNRDGALTDESFVFVSAPRPGERVGSHFTVEGGATTRTGQLRWRLTDRRGVELASGKEPTAVGSEPEAFAFAVSYLVADRQIGQLEVSEVADTDSDEVPLTNSVPVVLHDGPPPRSMARRP